MRFPSERIALAIEAGLPHRGPAFTGSEPCVTIGYEFYEESDHNPTRRMQAMYREVCNNCPMVLYFFTWAIHREKHLYWAGLTSKERASVRRIYNIKLEEPHA